MKRHGVKPSDIDLVLISHLHGDHFNGLGYLMMEYLYESQPRAGKVTFAGPPGLEKRLYDLFAAMYKETDLTPIKPRVRFEVLKPNVTHKLHGIEVDTIRTPHTTKDVSLGFRLRLDGKIIAFTGDSGWTEQLFDLSNSADLFLCECTYFDSVYDFHLSYPMISANLDRFKSKRMILTHLGREVLDRADQIKLEMASDGMRIDL
jgi:ribonuclease BN (tRNA processing enzyme)